MSASNLISTVCLLACFLVQSLSEGQQQITVKMGDNVPLRCLGPRGGDIKLLEWTRSDLKEKRFVFYFNEKPLSEYQLSTFHGRVDLVDPQMKNGDTSVILKNVTVNDTGTYECRVANKGGKPELGKPIILTVIDSSGDKDGGNKDGGNNGGHVGLVVGLSVVTAAVAVIVVGFVIYRKRKEKHETGNFI